MSTELTNQLGGEMAVTGVNDTEGEKALELLVNEIMHLLQSESMLASFKRWVGHSSVHQSNRSWTHISIQLHYFVQNPQKYYTPLMERIEKEKHHFPLRSPFRKKLDKLTELLAKGPTFSEEYHYKIRIPDKAKKRRSNK